MVNNKDVQKQYLNFIDCLYTRLEKRTGPESPPGLFSFVVDICIHLSFPKYQITHTHTHLSGIALGIAK